MLLFVSTSTDQRERDTAPGREVAKRFEEGKAAAAVRIEVEAWGGQGKEAKYTRKEGGGAKGHNDKADRGDSDDGDLDKVVEGGPEGGGNDAENEVLEDKQKKALLDCRGRLSLLLVVS